MKTRSYGEIARSNGIKYEKEVTDILNNSIATLKQLNRFVPINLSNVRTELLSNKKVPSIFGVKTTSKSDIVVYNNDIPIPISVKMSNKGTQLQIISLKRFLEYMKFKNINCNRDVIRVWKKFLGITVPDNKELLKLNKNRTKKCKHMKRYWLNELSIKERLIIELFIYVNKDALLEMCIKNGMCSETENKAEYFLINSNSYTEYGTINFTILSYDELIKKIDVGKPMITKNGNLQLNKYVGIQRKGSGKTLAAKNGIQFKDRGFNKIFKDNLFINKRMKGLSLFACSGIAEYYLKDTNVDIVLANELVKDRCDIYKHFYKDAEMIHGDINEKFDEIVSKSKKLDVDFIIATPPCQSFSNAGRKQLDDKRTPLFLTLIESIKKIKPKYVLIENVPSFMKSKYSKDSDDKIQDRFDQELGDMYVIKTKILNTKDFEVPQARKRSITLLSLKTLEEWKHPKVIKKTITVKDAIGHLPSLESGEKSDIHKWHKAKTHNKKHIKWLSHTPTGKTAFDNSIFFPQKDGRRIKGFKTTYKRITWDNPSPTITMSSGSISSQNNVHPGNSYEKDGETLYDNARALTVYEIMLLTGLDDAWDPPTSNEKIVRDIIGEAVPPKMIYHIINNIPI